MRTNRVVLRVMLTTSFLCCFAAAGVTIYDNTGPWLGGYGWTALEQGDEVHAASSERLVTRLIIGVSRQNEPGIADFQARLYSNDGVSGQPGTMLWQSPVLTDIQLSGGVQLIPIDVPEIRVPDSFTWTLQVLDSSPGAAVGLVNAGPPLVGVSPSYDWLGGAGGWTRLQYSNWMARVEAVPEPSSSALLIGGLSFLLAFTRVGRTSRMQANAGSTSQLAIESHRSGVPDPER